MKDAVQMVIEILGIATLAAFIWMALFTLLYTIKGEEVTSEMRTCLNRVHSIPVGTEPVPVASQDVWDYCVKEVSR